MRLHAALALVVASNAMALCSCASAKLKGSVPWSYRITLEHLPNSDAWRIQYVLPGPIAGVRFRYPEPFREDHWKISATGVLTLESRGQSDVLRRVDGRTFDGFELTVPTYELHHEKDYEVFISYTDGGRLVYTPKFEIEPLDDKLEPSATLHIVPRSGERVIHRGQIHTTPFDWRSEDDQGMYLYFGSTEPVRSERMMAVVDTGMPQWLRMPIESILPRLFDYFADQTGVPLDSRLPVFLVYGELAASESVSIGGGARSGVHIDVRLGSKFRTERDPRLIEEVMWTTAHEAAHVWHGQLYSNAVPGADWMHEGGSDAFAGRALVALGELTVERFIERASEDASFCALGLQGEPLKASARPGRYMNFYKCGATMALLTEGAMRRTQPDASILQFWGAVFRAAPSRRYEEALYFRTLAPFDPGDEIAQALRLLLDEPIADSAALLISTAARVGLTFERATPPPKSDYDRVVAQRALQAIAESDCAEGVAVAGAGRSMRIRRPASCRTLSPEMAITALAGSTLELDASGAYDAARAACANSAEIDVTVSGESAPLRVRCNRPLPDRPPYLRLRDWRPPSR
jgi:hypothetical protein